MTLLRLIGEATSGLEAISIYEQFQPDIVILDITMSDINGIEGVKALHLIDPNVKIIIISAMGQKDFILEALNYGVRDFVMKPLRKDYFIRAIERVLEM